MKGIVAVIVLVSFFVYSAMDLITVRYQQRLLYNELVRTQNVEQKLNQAWSYLQLERANLTSTAHINQVMSQKLRMTPADISHIIYIKDSELRKVPNPEVAKEQ